MTVPCSFLFIITFLLLVDCHHWQHQPTTLYPLCCSPPCFPIPAAPHCLMSAGPCPPRAKCHSFFLGKPPVLWPSLSSMINHQCSLSCSQPPYPFPPLSSLPSDTTARCPPAPTFPSPMRPSSASPQSCQTGHPPTLPPGHRHESQCLCALSLPKTPAGSCYPHPSLPPLHLLGQFPSSGLLGMTAFPKASHGAALTTPSTSIPSLVPLPHHPAHALSHTSTPATLLAFTGLPATPDPISWSSPLAPPSNWSLHYPLPLQNPSTPQDMALLPQPMCPAWHCSPRTGQ